MFEQNSLKDRVVLCTGASSGIGQRMAQTLALAGASVFLVARREERLVKAVEEIQTNKNKTDY